MSRIVLVTGGARSGKSRFAEQLAAEQGEPVVYVAAAQAVDAEMGRRIDKHREQRPAAWTVIEEPLEIVTAVQSGCKGARVVLVECLSLWTANRLCALSGEPGEPDWWEKVWEMERALCEELGVLAAWVRENPVTLILVTNEVGWSLHPDTALGRAFQDMLGRLNQSIAAHSDALFLVVSGIAVNIKRLAQE